MTVTPEVRQPPDEPVQYLEIDTARWRRLMGWVAYGLFFVAVCSAFTLIFVQVSGSWRIAIGVVGFMVAYMVVMGHVTSKGLRGDGEPPERRR